MDKALNLYKRKGETPLQCLWRFRSAFPEYASETLSYAGRLDPMAEGVLVVLSGDENKNRDAYLKLDKKYRLEMLFGVSTDSFDLLGKPLSFSSEKPKISELVRTVRNLKGLVTLPYPPYSSKTVKGKPLFEWAREGKLGDIVIPERTTKIKGLSITGTEVLTAEDVLNNVIESVALVKGDFRQQEIIKAWREKFRLSGPCLKVGLDLACTSGTYARALVLKIGQEVSCPACLWSLKRTAVGGFNLSQAKTF